MEEVEIPQYFLCPISLQIMKDPVTVATGITYDRESITQWLLAAEEEATCPATKQPLARDAELTPNHTLRRLIQAWCIANSDKGIDRLPTPKSPLSKSRVHRLIRGLNNPQTFLNSLNKMEEIADEEDEKNRKCMEEAGVVNSMVLLIVKRFKESETLGLRQALRIFCLVWSPSEENKSIVNQNHSEFIPAISWIIITERETPTILDELKIQAMAAMKIATEVAISSSLDELTHEFFMEMATLIRTTKPITQQTTKDALHVLVHACRWGRNRLKIIEAGAIFEVIELELSSPGKRISELGFCLLAHLCSLAEGRQKFLKHAGGIAVVAKRTLTGSPATDDRAVEILAMISKCSATKEVVLEMLRVGAVSKLCMILQADCEVRLKKKAREILRSHSSVWSESPCIQEKYYGSNEGLRRPFSHTNIFVYVHRR